MSLTKPQIFLMLDGSSINARSRKKRDNKGKGKDGKPPKPDKYKDPVGALRWEFKHDSLFSRLNLTDAQIEEKCRDFKEKLDRGELRVD